MKNAITTILLLLFTVGIYAEEGVSYKALIKDNLGALVANEAINVRFIISDTGPADVYLETLTDSTIDARGIVILTIEDDTTSDIFTYIARDSYTHSLKVEIDIEPDGSFVDLGATQFMAVPYAKSATELSSGIEQVYIPALEARIRGLESAQPAAIGDLREGGIVFWVDPTNTSKGKVCALADAPVILSWNAAISYCNAYTNPDTGKGVHSDWYLPSKEELQLMYANLERFGCGTNTPGGTDPTLCPTRIGNFTTNYYWSSTEFYNFLAWLQRFENGTQSKFSSKISTVSVRAIRAF
jgi:hypothetical protein